MAGAAHCSLFIAHCSLKNPFSFPHSRFLWLNLLGMVIAVIVVIWGALRGLDVYTRHGRAVVVPDVRGMSLADAQTVFHSHGLACTVADSTYVKTQVPGCILDYTPAAGQKVKEGRLIYLTVNTLATPLQMVPDVADNSSLRQAEARLIAAGFRISEVELIPGEKDWVYGVKYRDSLLMEGERVPIGAFLTLVAGNGMDELPADSLYIDPDTGDTLVIERGPIIRPVDEEDPWF